MLHTVKGEKKHCQVNFPTNSLYGLDQYPLNWKRNGVIIFRFIHYFLLSIIPKNDHEI